MVVIALLIMIVGNSLLAPTNVVDRLGHHNSSNFIETQNKTRSLSKFSIGEVDSSMTPEDVMKKLGKPLSINKQYEPCAGDYLSTLVYDRFTISISGAYFLMNTTNPIYQTQEGIKVGDPIAKVKKIYDGLNLSWSQTDTSQKSGAITYQEEIQGFIFEFKKNRVTKINFYLNAC
jgi:hypothetical protein